MKLDRLAARRPRSLVAPSVLAAGLLVAGCSARGHHGHDDPPFVPYYDVWEIEPNDSHCCADEIGTLYVGGEIVIGGHVRDDSHDPFDGFAFESGEPIEVHFVLEPVDFDADLDLCVWDPALGEFAFCFDSPSSVEVGHFVVPSSFDSFHLVVSSFDGDAEYRLTVWAEPVAFGALAAPAAPPEHDKGERAVPFRLYGPEEALSQASEPAVIDRGIVVEFDETTGEVRVRDLVVREDGLLIGPAR